MVGKSLRHQFTSAGTVGECASIEELWIDIGIKDKEQAESFVALGDEVTYAEVHELA